MKVWKRRLKKLPTQNARAFSQKGLHGLASVALYIEKEHVAEIGSSSFVDPQGHIAKIKMAMGIAPSLLDTLWAYLGDTDASMYIGFQPGLHPTRVHPQLWLQRLVGALPHIPEDSLQYIDKAFAEMQQSFERIKSSNDIQAVGSSSYPEPHLEKVDLKPLFPLMQRTLQ